MSSMTMFCCFILQQIIDVWDAKWHCSIIKIASEQCHLAIHQNNHVGSEYPNKTLTKLNFFFGL